MKENEIKAVLFDFGGVIAEEGFERGLKAIGKGKGVNPDKFFAITRELINETGYVTGLSDEGAYWNAVREETGITGSDGEFREEILKRFVLRPKMIGYVRTLRTLGLTVSILSDQTDWLDEINRRTPFYRHFDRIFNSYRMKKSKRDASVFRDVCSAMGLIPGEVLFIDDNRGNIERASREGLKTIHYGTPEDFEREISVYIQGDRLRDRS